MVDYESRIVRGWRGRLEDEGEAALKNVWKIKPTVIHKSAVETPQPDSVAGKERWFSLEYGHSRNAALAEVRVLSKRRRQIRDAERSSEQIEAKREQDRKRYASSSPEWLAEDARKRRERRAANPEGRTRIERRYRLKHRDAILARAKLMRAKNLEEYLAAERARYKRCKEARSHRTPLDMNTLPTTPLLTLDDIADIWKCTYMHARKVLVRLPEFPQPAPGSTLKRRVWVTQEVLAYIHRESLKPSRPHSAETT